MVVISRYRTKSAQVAPRDVGRLTRSLWGGRSYIASWANLRPRIGISSFSYGERKKVASPLLPLLLYFYFGLKGLEALLADGLHLNSSGHELLFRELSAFLQRLFPQG